MNKDKPWVPFVLPLAIIVFVGINLAVFGTILLYIALATYDIAPKGVHSLYVIIVALILSAIVAGACGAYAMGGNRRQDTSH